MENHCAFFLLTAIIFILKIGVLQAYIVDNDPYRHTAILDKDGKYQLEWLVDWKESRVNFNVTVETKGYVGLGISRKGKMLGADIVIGGVMPNGQPYFSDRHAIGNQIPVEDASQDWDLHAARESSTHTFLSFSRPFETCDEDHDLPINNDVIALLWAFGEKDDELEYHHQNRGVFDTYLLDADLTPRELQNTAVNGFGRVGSKGNVLGDWKVWRIDHQGSIPAQDTTYICSIHKTPVNQKSHVVGFRAILPTDVERRHIHHFLLHRCIAPGGSQEEATRLFGHLEGHREECYVLSQPPGRIPTQYCTEVIHVWAVGQLPNFIPDHVGLPIYPNEYFMLQMHYDNPNTAPAIEVNHALEIFYTDNLRTHDAGVISFGATTPASPSIMVPPNSLAHRTYGHCASGCTKTMLPPTGVRIFASNLHTHLAGRGVRLMHLRDGKELPWISADDNYNFNFQQIRILREERLLLPGDSLINRCVYENTDRQGNSTIGSFSSRQEMCSGFLWYYNKIPDRSMCRSTIRSDVYNRFLQIYNTTWSDSSREMVVTAPPANAGLLVSEVGNFRIDWTLANRKRIQELHRYLPQVSSCVSQINFDEKEDNSERGGGSWFSRGLKRLTTPQPRLVPQRYAPPPPLTRRVTSTTSSRSSASSPLLTRPSSRQTSNNVPKGQDDNPEIYDPDSEFISVYPKDIVPYERPSVCPTLLKK